MHDFAKVRKEVNLHSNYASGHLLYEFLTSFERGDGELWQYANAIYHFLFLFFKAFVIRRTPEMLFTKVSPQSVLSCILARTLKRETVKEMVI